MSRILIVEDHQTLLRSLSRILTALSHDVIVAETGEEGYRLALIQQVDLLILDVMLPGRSGFEILRELRQEGFPRPVLILTARDTVADREKAAACGANGFLSKPFAMTDFLQRVTSLLESSASGSLSGNPTCDDV